MKILISANGYPTDKYALQSFVRVIAREFVRQGHNVTVIAPQSVISCLKHKIGIVPERYEDSFFEQDKRHVVRVLRPKIYSLGEGITPKLTYWLSRKVVNNSLEKLNESFDAIYSIFWWSATNVIQYSKKHNIPLFVEASEDKVHINELGDDRIISELKSNTKGVVCVSSKNLLEMQQTGLAAKDKCVIIPNGYNPEEFYHTEQSVSRHGLGYDEDDFIVAFCGRFNNRKGVFRLEDAIAKLNDDKIKVIFIGRPIEGSKRMPNCRGILHCGPLPHSEVSTYLNAADVYVLPTLAEGCSNSIVEAIACGLPIISSNMPFNTDILDNSNAILIDPLDVDAIASSIKQLKEDKTKKNMMAASSLRKSQELTIHNRIARIIDYINKNS